MKKSILFLLLAVIFSGSLVAAASLSDTLDGMANGIAFLFGDVEVSGASQGEIMFIKLLVFILLFAVIHTVVKKTPRLGDTPVVTLIVSLVVSIIAVRFMTTESLINFIWLPYGVLGIVISVLIPFIIGFFFIESFESAGLRKFSWTVFAVLFAGLWFTRRGSLATGDLWYQNLSWMYLAIAMISLLLILFDKNIFTAMFKGSLSKDSERKKRMLAAKISQEIEELRADLARTDSSKARIDIRNEINSRERALNDLLRS